MACFSKSFKEHIYHLDDHMSLMKGAGLMLRAKKTYLGCQSGEVLGYKVDRLGAIKALEI